MPLIRLPSMLLLWTTALGAVACSHEGSAAAAHGTVTVRDDAGRAVRLQRAPERIICLVPAVTEMIVALGAADRLVARTDYDVQPELAALSSVGGGLTPNLEWLVSRRPDLVIGWPDGTARTVLSRLRELGVPVYGARMETIADADSTLARIGRLLGRGPAADSIVRANHASLAAVRRRAAARRPVRVLYVRSLQPPLGVGPGTFLDQLITLAGGRNIFADARTGWPQLSLEEVLERDPQILVVPDETGDTLAVLHRLRTAPGWRTLPAVRAGRVAFVDPNLFHRAGPHLPEAARRLEAILASVARAREGAESAGGEEPAP